MKADRTMSTCSGTGPSRIVADADLFRERFDRETFAFQHRLADHPLFEPHRLLQLAKEMAKNARDVYFDVGDVRIDQRWDETPRCERPIDELLHHIETAGAWIILRRAEKDPEYSEIFESCLAEIEASSGCDLRKVAKFRNAIVFINSPNRASSYHVDRRCNFLLQIRGTKTISTFDRNDREVLPEVEIERFWTVDNNSAIYKPHLQERARVFELAPGCAVHIPVNAPHWVKNGPEVSISLSINFHYHDGLLADIYRANYWLRRFGLRPASPRQCAVRDAAKSTMYRSARALRATTHYLVGKS